MPLRRSWLKPSKAALRIRLFCIGEITPDDNRSRQVLGGWWKRGIAEIDVRLTAQRFTCAILHWRDHT